MPSGKKEEAGKKNQLWGLTETTTILYVLILLILTTTSPQNLQAITA